MGMEIKTWQIIDGKLASIDTTLMKEGRTEPYDLEPWLESDPGIIGPNIMIIGRQVSTKNGPLDLLAIDQSGNTVIIEIKRGELPREVVAQAIDYASDVSEWTLEKLSEIYSRYKNVSLQDSFSKFFPDVDLELINFNSTQRIILVGFSIESSIERMIGWLSDHYGMGINAIVLSYVKTKSGEELLTKTSILSEEMEMEKRKKQRSFQVSMSDEPGTYNTMELKKLLVEYFSQEKKTIQRMRDILIPNLLKTIVLSRVQLEKAFIDYDPSYEGSNVGLQLTGLSNQFGMEKNDFLRQVISYEYPKYKWMKDNFSIRPNYRELVKDVLAELKGK